MEIMVMLFILEVCECNSTTFYQKIHKHILSKTALLGQVLDVSFSLCPHLILIHSVVVLYIQLIFR